MSSSVIFARAFTGAVRTLEGRNAWTGGGDHVGSHVFMSAAHQLIARGGGRARLRSEKWWSGLFRVGAMSFEGAAKTM